MMYFSQAEIDQLILEDVPLHDETTRALGLPDAPGSLTYTARQHGVLAGMAPLLRLAQALGLRGRARHLQPVQRPRRRLWRGHAHGLTGCRVPHAKGARHTLLHLHASAHRRARRQGA